MYYLNLAKNERSYINYTSSLLYEFISFLMFINYTEMPIIILM